MTAELLTLCTGNATRSVLAEVLLAGLLPDASITSAGTLVIEGQPISWRTRAAFESIDIPPPNHRGRQAAPHNLHPTRLILAAAPEHVAWIRRVHPEVADRTITMKRLAHIVRTDGEIGALARHRLETAVIEDWEEVVDPGGMEVDAYLECATEVRDLVDETADAIGHFLRSGPTP